MLTRVGALLIVAVSFTGLLGCVSADVYRIKEREAQTLFKANEEIQYQNKSLIDEKNELQLRLGEIKKENEGLQGLIEKQNEEIVYLKNRTDKLLSVGEGLRDRVEKLNDKIAGLNKENQRLVALSRPENLLRSLGERLADLQKQVDALSGENEKLKTKQVMARPEEEKSGTEGAKTIKGTAEKPQAVPVAASHKADDSTEGRQLEEEREQQALSEEWEKLSQKP